MQRPTTLVPAAQSKKKAVSLNTLVLKINTDEAYRAKFLESPVEELRKHGIVLDAASARQVRSAARDLKKKLPGLGRVPSGAGGALKGEGPSPGEFQVLCI